jgi:uncharacterized protein (UPF0332 family)
MAKWDVIARDNLTAARVLAKAGLLRSSVSRTYYAAFSAVTFVLTGEASFPRGYETPLHQTVTGLLDRHLPRHRYLRQIKAAVRRLYNDRIIADYRAGRTIDAATSLAAQQSAHSVCLYLGVIE